MSILVLKYQKSFVLIIKDNYIFNIIKTIAIKLIEAILETQNSKKAEFKFKKSKFIVKKQKIQQLYVKHVTSNQKQIDLNKRISKTKEKIEKLIIIAKIIKQRNPLKQIINYLTSAFKYYYINSIQ